VQQLVINTQAQRELAKRGFDSTVLPNIFDFKLQPPGRDAYNADLRSSIGLAENDLLFLQPTRVIPRKGIELAIELVHRLTDLPIKLLITHSAEYNTRDYLEELFVLARKLNVDMLYLPDRFKPQRQPDAGKDKIYSLWDAYVYADFITYPSLYEGFGNALLETIFFQKPLLVNRYSVYREDIEPAGLKAITIEGIITKDTVKEVHDLLANPDQINRMTATNLKVASNNFSYETAKSRLERVISALHR
jgi:glycosyltransferase involved in cell wall biosynthesis